ncbi:MAG: hypothetical protein JST68_07035 [Bacteroidetes bacterium]|nr:hypothetical protein [Bacteroidota bacterium]
MKQLSNAMLSLLMLSITGNLYAQSEPNQYKRLPPQDKIFALPPFSIKRNYHVDLGKGNQFQIEIADSADLPRIQNVDSLLLVFLSDMKAFRDSLADPLTVKRIDYRIEGSGVKKLRIHQFRPPASSFLLDGKEPAQLRLQQDTVYILLVFTKGRETHYNRLGFFLNQYDLLENLVTTGLNEKVSLIKDKGNWRWRNGSLAKEDDPTISASRYNNDNLQVSAIMGVQNYKNYLTPSVDLGIRLHLQRQFNLHNFRASWQPLFLFAPDSHGQLQTYRNDFVVLSYHYDRSDYNAGDKETVGLATNISLGYLVHREGNFFNKNTFQLSAGDLSFRNGKIRLQPLLYFNDFFRGVTPALRLSFRAL